MQKRHIAIFTLMGNGHVYPVLPLCAELVRRGYRTTYMTSDHYAPIVAEVGAEPVVVETQPMSQALQDEVNSTFTLPFSDPRTWVTASALQRHSFDVTRHLLSQAQRFYRQNVPDLILYDRYIIVGRVLASLLDVPTVQISPHFAYPDNCIYWERGVCRNPPPTFEVARALNGFLATFGMAAEGNLWRTESLNIHFIPEAFQYHSRYFDERFCFVGALLNRPYVPCWKNRADGKPIVLVSGLSGQRDSNVDGNSQFEVFIEALRECDCHCILSIGDNGTGSAPSTLPRNFEINRKASHLEILPHASLSICHGGMGSTLEAICHGVPVLAVPMNPGCEEISYRIVELGLGTQLRRDETHVEAIRDGVSRMLVDSALKERVREMQASFRSAGGECLAADRIEAFLHSAPPASARALPQ